MSITLKQKEEFIDLRSEGLSFDTISKTLNIAKNTLIKLEIELENEISNTTYLKIQALIEKYELNKNIKVEKHLMMLSKVMSEIEKRDLSQLNIKELLSLKASLEEDLKKTLKIKYSTDVKESIYSFNELVNKSIPL